MLVAQGEKDKAVDTLDAMVKAERDRATSGGQRFEGFLGDAESLLAELAVETGRDSLKADLGSSAAGAAPAPPGGANPQLSQEIVDALRKQLEQKGASEDGKGLTKEIVDALQQNVDEGATGGTTLQVPADEMPKPGAQAPAPEPAAGAPDAPDAPRPPDPTPTPEAKQAPQAPQAPPQAPPHTMQGPDQAPADAPSEGPAQ
jgi:hypothetical protein